MKHLPKLALISFATAVPAEGSREHDAHEHGVGALNIAVFGETLAMELEAPGSDIVGFEYEAATDEDKAAITGATALLSDPAALFELPSDAGCSVAKAEAHLDGDEHDHDEHGHDDEHEEHVDSEGHDDHDHDEHKDHDDHDDEKHDDHDHDEHDHDEEAGGSHTEFHAEYEFTCTNMDALTNISFPYFEQFPNALELEVQVITTKGAMAYEVERDEPELALEGL